MKSKGQKAYERYITKLASKIKFGDKLPPYSELNDLAKDAWEYSADTTAAIDKGYDEVVAVEPAPAPAESAPVNTTV